MCTCTCTYSSLAPSQYLHTSLCSDELSCESSSVPSSALRATRALSIELISVSCEARDRSWVGVSGEHYIEIGDWR